MIADHVGPAHTEEVDGFPAVVRVVAELGQAQSRGSFGSYALSLPFTTLLRIGY